MTSKYANTHICYTIHRSWAWVIIPESWILNFRSWSPESWTLSLRLWILGSKIWVLDHGVIILRFQVPVLDTNPFIIYYKGWQHFLRTCNRFYKVWQKIITEFNWCSEVAGITKCDHIVIYLPIFCVSIHLSFYLLYIHAYIWQNHKGAIKENI